MSSMFDAPAHLVMLLASVVAGQEPVEPVVSEPVRAAILEQGPYDFSETNWLAAVRKGFGGARLEPHRGRIFATSNGRLYVPVLSEKKEILSTRQNALDARAVAIDEARFNAVELKKRLGREASVKDLYAAHVFGLDLAARLAGLKATQPNAVAAIALPDLAAAYPSAATQKGAALTIAEVYQRLPDAPFETIALERGTSNDSVVSTAVQPAGAGTEMPLRGEVNDESAFAIGSTESWLPVQVTMKWTTEVHSSSDER